ncbi:SpoVR family protein [Calditrichota bacterium]
MTNYSIADLEQWDERIREKVAEFGLDPYPQIFEMCNSDQMIGYMAYSGMPSRYPHWSYGKQFEKQKTQYNYGVTGLPYEMVINSNPSLAYLMEENTLLLQVLTIAHVYAHNDFFKNNFTFRNTHAQYTLDNFKARADRVRKYQEDPSKGLRRVEEILDAAHTLSFNCDRYGVDDKPGKPIRVIKKKSESEAIDEIELQEDVPPETNQEYLRSNLLLHIRDNARHLKDWERDLLTIVHEEALYFIPQIETKIMNEGWASYWHQTILNSLDLPSELQMEFFVRHNQVLRPIPGGMNPYYVGYTMLKDIERRWDSEHADEREDYSRPGGEGREKMFQVRESDRDESFIRQYLSVELMREMFLFQHEKKGNDRVVTKVASDQDWQELKNTLLKQVGMNSFPVIKVVEGADERGGDLYLRHEYDGRELEAEYARRTMEYLYTLWENPIKLETVLNEKKSLLLLKESGNFDVQVIS